jgi:predicted RNA-binding Zn-ribbon protein involved in translation (DUF1610 family)
MAAFNWILFDGACPECGSVTPIRCQTHVASDYDGDAGGRFHDRTYRFGERMAWWPESDSRYIRWSEDCVSLPDGSSSEACYSDCTSCGAELCAVLRFEALVPRELLALRLEADWPSDYPK